MKIATLQRSVDIVETVEKMVAELVTQKADCVACHSVENHRLYFRTQIIVKHAAKFCLRSKVDSLLSL